MSVPIGRALSLRLDLQQTEEAPGLDELMASLRGVREGGVDAAGVIESIVESAPPGKIAERSGSLKPVGAGLRGAKTAESLGAERLREMVMRAVGDVEFTAPDRDYDPEIDDEDLREGGAPSSVYPDLPEPTLAERLERVVETLSAPKSWGTGSIARSVKRELVSWRMQALCRAVTWAVHGVLFRLPHGVRAPNVPVGKSMDEDIEWLLDGPIRTHWTALIEGDGAVPPPPHLNHLLQHTPAHLAQALYVMFLDLFPSSRSRMRRRIGRGKVASCVWSIVTGYAVGEAEAERTLHALYGDRSQPLLGDAQVERMRTSYAREARPGRHGGGANRSSGTGTFSQRHSQRNSQRNGSSQRNSQRSNSQRVSQWGASVTGRTGRFATDRWTARSSLPSGRNTGRGFFDEGSDDEDEDEGGALGAGGGGDGGIGGGGAAIDDQLRGIVASWAEAGGEVDPAAAETNKRLFDHDYQMRRNAQRVSKWLEFAREDGPGERSIHDRIGASAMSSAPAPREPRDPLASIAVLKHAHSPSVQRELDRRKEQRRDERLAKMRARPSTSGRARRPTSAISPAKKNQSQAHIAATTTSTTKTPQGVQQRQRPASAPKGRTGATREPPRSVHRPTSAMLATAVSPAASKPPRGAPKPIIAQSASSTEAGSAANIDGVHHESNSQRMSSWPSAAMEDELVALDAVAALGPERRASQRALAREAARLLGDTETTARFGGGVGESRRVRAEIQKVEAEWKRVSGTHGAKAAYVENVMGVDPAAARRDRAHVGAQRKGYNDKLLDIFDDADGDGPPLSSAPSSLSMLASPPEPRPSTSDIIRSGLTVVGELKQPPSHHHRALPRRAAKKDTGNVSRAGGKAKAREVNFA